MVIMLFAVFKKNKTTRLVKGATLLESLTALAIVTSVMGAAFTLYTQTISSQPHALRTKAMLIQNQFEQSLKNPAVEVEQNDPGLLIETTHEPVRHSTQLYEHHLVIKTKKGKIILQKKYFTYQPANNTNSIEL